MKAISKNWLVTLVLSSLPGMAFAQANNAFPLVQSVPALDEVGLIGLVAAVSAVAGWIIKRRGK